MNTAKKPAPSAKKTTPSALATLYVLMDCRPRITQPQPQSWLVEVCDVKRGTFVQRSRGPLPEALKAFRHELNLYVVELHRLAEEAGVLV
jgi:hypothetical protein